MKPVILGAGLAGLTVALSLAPMPCILVSPRKLGEGCSSAWAQGGIAAALGANDNADAHAADTLAAGNGLNDAAIVRQTVNDATAIIETLAQSGVSFDRDEMGNFRLGLEAAHRNRRIVHALDATGPAVMRALIAHARSTPSIEIIENAQHRATETLSAASHIVLATGGAAALWRDTTNPHENWGGGLALAARAGATLGDLEFMQFHPTAIDIGRDPMPLASEALRGEGAILIDENNMRFTDELQPRDIVARAIQKHITAGHHVFLDARHIDNFAARFPTINGLCLANGIDPAITPIPVRPAAHYHMGGILTDAHGRADIPGLWACGEVACTGLHGANRLASNSLLEAASFGRRVAEDIKGTPASRIPPMPQHLQSTDDPHKKQIRALMSDNVGVVRHHDGLKRAETFLAPLAAQSDMALVALMITRSALRREESRGAHYRDDFPQSHNTGERSRFRLDDKEVA